MLSALLAVTVVFSLYLYFQLTDRILIGVEAGGVKLGNLTTEEAADRLAATYSSDEALIVSAGESAWTAAPADLGLSIDAEATAQRALRVGHDNGMLKDLGTLTASALSGTTVEPALTLNADTARTTLEGWQTAAAREPQDATLRIENGTVVAVPGVDGHALNVDATLAALQTDPGAVVASGDLPLILTPISPRVPDASGALAEAQAMLAAPLEVIAYDPITDQRQTWEAAPPEVASWLAVEQTEEGPRVAVTPERVTAYVNAQSASLGEGRSLDVEASAGAITEALRGGTAATLTVIHPPTTYTVRHGDTLIGVSWEVGMPYWRIIDANPGLTAETQLTVGQQLTIPSKNDLLPLPVVPGKRLRVDISEQRLHVYENGTEIQTFIISTGIDRSPTQPGVFQVQTHDINAYASLWDLTMPHFLGIYEAWPDFMNGFHGLPTLSNGRLLWADVLGRPASYGCIILDLDDGEWLYNWAEDGVVVEITE